MDDEGPPPWLTVRYDPKPLPPPREPSWHKPLLAIIRTLVVAGILAIFGVLWSMSAEQERMSGRLGRMEERELGQNNLLLQRLDAQERHLEAHDKTLDEMREQIWLHHR